MTCHRKKKIEELKSSDSPIYCSSSSPLTMAGSFKLLFHLFFEQPDFLGKHESNQNQTEKHPKYITLYSICLFKKISYFYYL